MKKSLLFPVIAGLIFILNSCGHNANQTAVYSVIPLPASIEENTEVAGFNLNGNTRISYPKGNADLERNAGFLRDYISQLTGHDLRLTDIQPDNDAIVLKDNLGGENAEGYEITVNENLIEINGNSAAGNFYGIQTIRKSIPKAEKGDVVFPAVTITDQPRFSYRGAHFDVSRHFFPTDSVKAFIDLLALHNINRLHWHLTDDQGWRIEIKKRPLLTELGSKRSGTVIGHNSGVYDSIPVEGYFTQDEVKDIINYAADRYITIIPEIDLPGHMLAALKGYPELGCTGGPYEVWQQWGVSEDVLCAGNDSTYVFIDEVLDEIADLFPSEYVHIGGDESPRSRWMECEQCQAKIRSLGLKSDEEGTKEEKLQSYVTKHANDFLSKKGKKTIGWDEILEGGAAPGTVIMSWRGEEGGIEAAKKGHDVIMTPNTYLYFDYYQTQDIEGEPEAIGGYIPIEKVYSYEPYPSSLSEEEAAHIIGVQANLWTEYIPTFSQALYQELPRMAALSEVQWSNAPKDYEGFVKRLPRMIRQYDLNGYNYCKHIYNISAEFIPDPQSRSIGVVFATIDEAPVYYTLDGSEPTSASERFNDTLRISSDAKIKAVSIRDNKPGRIFADSIIYHKATLKPITLLTPPSKKYAEKGAVTLVDGMFGKNGYSAGGWLGFNGEKMISEIDLEKPQIVSEVSIRFCIATGAWIFDARAIKIEISSDGENWQTVAEENYPQLQESKNEIVNHIMRFKPVEARYIKVTADTETTMPEWHSGKGRQAFIFLDEIVVN